MAAVIVGVLAGKRTYRAALANGRAAKAKLLETAIARARASGAEPAHIARLESMLAETTRVAE